MEAAFNDQEIPGVNDQFDVHPLENQNAQNTARDDQGSDNQNQQLILIEETKDWIEIRYSEISYQHTDFIIPGC